MAKKMKPEQYLCVSAYVRGLESQLLTGADLSRMIDTDSLQEAIRLLTEHGYPEMTPTMASLDETLRTAREATLESLSAFLPSGSNSGVILDLFRIHYDYHNVKVALKALWTGADAAHLLMQGGRLDPQELWSQLLAGEDAFLPQPLQDAVRAARETVGATGDPQKGDLLLDKACFAEQNAMAEASGNAFLKDYTRLLTDIANLRTLVRVLRMGKNILLLQEALMEGGSIPADVLLEAARGGTVTEPYQATALEEAAVLGAHALADGGLTAFEKACDDTLTHFLQGTILISFGPEPVLAYIAAREQEQRNIRIIISGRLAGLSSATIRERMRESYV